MKTFVHMSKLTPLATLLVLSVFVQAFFTTPHLHAGHRLAGPVSDTVIICTDGGIVEVAIDETGSPVDDKILDHHCPLCTVGGLFYLSARVTGLPTLSRLTKEKLLPNELYYHPDSRVPDTRNCLDPPESP